MRNCGRCGREVYYAEQKVALDKVWHSFCFSCYKCRRLLDSCSVNTYCDELFCNSCYKCICDPNGVPEPCCPPPICCPPPPCPSKKKNSRMETCCRDPRETPRCDPPCCPPDCTGGSQKRRCCDGRCCNPCCDPRVGNVCNPCCKELECVPCRDPCCNCCNQGPPVCCPNTSCYSLRAATPLKKCRSKIMCLEDCEPPTCLAKCRPRSCSPPPCRPKCCPKKCNPCSTPRPGTTCATPCPRGITNYYSRKHDKFNDDDCKGACYCPPDCRCPHKGRPGRNACPKACDPCAIIDCPELKDACKCCPSKRSPTSQKKGCCGGGSNNGGPQQKRCPDPCREDPCDPCCDGPYIPPCRKPIFYPPIKCCQDPCSVPEERISYTPCPTPRQPTYCTCGAPNPCDCDLGRRRRLAKSTNTPCCRRCGRKVYAAEKIVASGGAFHSCCYNCYCCHKALEVTSVYENQGEIYCKQCYTKFFGIQGYGYGTTLLAPL